MLLEDPFNNHVTGSFVNGRETANYTLSCREGVITK